jgi:6-phosphofructokinase
MGRHAGWIALHAGIASSAHAILIPERPQSLPQICDWVLACRDSGRVPLVVVAEGFRLTDMKGAYSERGLDAAGRPRLGGIGELLAPLIEARTGIEARATVLGHIQRGGIPTAFDRVLATRLGIASVAAAIDADWGSMVALRGTDIVRVPLADASLSLHTVPKERYEEAAVLFG